MLKDEKFSYCHKRRKDFKYNLRFFKNNSKPYTKPVYYFGDFEYNGYNNRFISFQHHKYEAETYLNVKNPQRGFLSLLDMLMKNELTIMFFHNLRYDINCILKIIFEKETDKIYKKMVKNRVGNAKLTYLIRDNTGYMEIEFNKNKLILIDSMIFFSISLDKTFKLLGIKSHKGDPHKKLWFKEDFKYHDYHIFLWYAYNDVFKTDKIITYIDNFMKKNDINYSWLLSKASLAKKIYIKNNMPDKYLFTRDLTPQQFYVLWNTYRGGFCRFFNKRIIKNELINVYDIKSSYPFSMTHKFPSNNDQCMRINNINNLNKSYMNDKDFTGCLIFEHIELKFDLLPEFDKQQRINYIKKGKDIFLSLEEFLLFKEKNIIRDCKLKVGFIWHCSIYPYKKYIKKYFKKKEYAKKQNKNIEAMFYKILLNSLYGSSVEKFEMDRTVLDDKELLNFQFGKLHSLVYAQRITALGRVNITNELINILINGPTDVYYMDTDSIFTNRKIKTGKNLGDYEKETDGDNLIVLGRKKYLLYDNSGNVKKLGSLGIGLKSKHKKNEISDRALIQIYNYCIRNKIRYSYETISKVSRKYRKELLLPNQCYVTDKLYGWDFIHEN